MSYIEEDKLGFHFDAGWEVAKYDDQPIYREIDKAVRHTDGCPGTKGVDFVATNGNAVTLVEVKDFRLGRVQNRDLEAEIPAKVRDTCAGLIASSRRSPHALWQKVGASVVERKQDLFIVLWLEEDMPPARHKVRCGVLQKQLKKSLHWIGTRRVLVVSRNTLGSRSIAGIERVESLKGASTATNPSASKTKS